MTVLRSTPFPSKEAYFVCPQWNGLTGMCTWSQTKREISGAIQVCLRAIRENSSSHHLVRITSTSSHQRIGPLGISIWKMTVRAMLEGRKGIQGNRATGVSSPGTMDRLCSPPPNGITGTCTCRTIAQATWEVMVVTRGLRPTSYYPVLSDCPWRTALVLDQ